MNNYGHPGSDTTNRIQKYTSQIYRTDQSGDIIITSDGSHYSVKVAKKG